MKALKHALATLASSALLWIGAAGALVSFSVYYLLWSGHLSLIAELADALDLGLAVPFFFAFIFMASIGIAVSGLIIGILHLCLKLIEKTATRTSERPQ